MAYNTHILGPHLYTRHLDGGIKILKLNCNVDSKRDREATPLKGVVTLKYNLRSLFSVAVKC
jgi:hypothetical protein